MDRYIALIPPKEFNLPKHVLLRLLEYLYGLSETGDAWNQKLKEALIRILKMTPLTGDPESYMHISKEPTAQQNAMGPSGRTLTTCCRAGTSDFKELTQRLRDEIKLKKSKEPPFVFARIRVHQGQASEVTLDQRE